MKSAEADHKELEEDYHRQTGELGQLKQDVARVFSKYGLAFKEISGSEAHELVRFIREANSISGDFDIRLGK